VLFRWNSQPGVYIYIYIYRPIYTPQQQVSKEPWRACRRLMAISLRREPFNSDQVDVIGVRWEREWRNDGWRHIRIRTTVKCPTWNVINSSRPFVPCRSSSTGRTHRLVGGRPDVKRHRGRSITHRRDTGHRAGRPRGEDTELDCAHVMNGDWSDGCCESTGVPAVPSKSGFVPNPSFVQGKPWGLSVASTTTSRVVLTYISSTLSFCRWSHHPRRRNTVADVVAAPAAALVLQERLRTSVGDKSDRMSLVRFDLAAILALLRRSLFGRLVSPYGAAGSWQLHTRVQEACYMRWVVSWRSPYFTVEWLTIRATVACRTHLSWLDVHWRDKWLATWTADNLLGANFHYANIVVQLVRWWRDQSPTSDSVRMLGSWQG